LGWPILYLRQAFSRAYSTGRSQARSSYFRHRLQLVGSVASKPPSIFKCSLIPSLSFTVSFPYLVLHSLIPSLSFTQSHSLTQFYSVSFSHTVFFTQSHSLTHFMQSHSHIHFYAVLSLNSVLCSLIPKPIFAQSHSLTHFIQSHSLTHFYTVSSLISTFIFT
jgi:hypothetical protein